MTPELETLKSKLRAVWTAGDFSQIAKSYAQGGAEFIERLNVQPGMKVLDVAWAMALLQFQPRNLARRRGVWTLHPR